jgi:glucosamine 6-phosphate synthetase-like amidotransferase/phosphosugar isomerase protein
VKLDLTLVALVLNMVATLYAIMSSRKKTSETDELTLTARIARAKVVNDEMAEIAKRSCASAFIEQGPKIKDLAREVFVDQMTVMMNQRWSPLAKMSEEISELRSAMEELRQTIADQPRQIKDMLIEIRNDRS